ncbi:zinc-binding dehydrogenase [Streptomyces sp. NPDC056653]|uniref:zinc-binding dehydrogenase n=1 Tax=Streptomyces sp. NPDC056653 TaxID=3345894 RepID=UPI0036B063A1
MARSSPPLVGRVASGEVRTPATQTLPLAEAAEVHRLLESGQTTGKLVLKPRSAGPAPPLQPAPAVSAGPALAPP